MNNGRVVLLATQSGDLPSYSTNAVMVGSAILVMIIIVVTAYVILGGRRG
ncbi:hypothetical protein OIE68_06480 [Nocardia vinacea]|uniref:Uncharacterized protein n=1 Tax=Nocardia vinacea TaxID=96468 RepID=A0ABZ1YPR5_9NOCA|nr:hypothetical protein OIE68_06480 [Nocardia vinacea]